MCFCESGIDEASKGNGGKGGELQYNKGWKWEVDIGEDEVQRIILNIFITDPGVGCSAHVWL